MAKLAKRPLLLIVRDGWGHNPYPEWNKANAVYLAKTPVDHRLRSNYPWVQIHTSGEDVGLPAGVMGNSEVGHQNIGAGRVVDQEQMRITRTIRDGTFYEIPTLVEAFEHAKRSGGSVHLMGLCSDGKVHSALDHLYALMEVGARNRFWGDRICVHAITDGRDTPPQSGIKYIEQIEEKCKEYGINPIASVIGRYYAMDRDNRWDRVETAYRLYTDGIGKPFPTARDAAADYYEHASEPSRSGDEFIVPSVTARMRPIRSGDSVIFFNFRGDRPRELTKAFVYDEFPFVADVKGEAKARQGFTRGAKIDNLYYCTMCEYEAGLPVKVAFKRPEKMVNILGAYAAVLGLRQFRCAETEKYPHVTFFFNDYRDEPFPGEDRLLVPSPRDITTYDQRPEMSALPVTEEMLRRIASDQYELFILNFANGDMVGHTGKLDAAIKAVETVDACVGRVVDAVMAKGGAAIVTADHGNCEQMIDPATGGPHTAHTTYDVDLIVVDDRLKGAYDLATGATKGGKRMLREGGRLADIAPTLLAVGALSQPGEMSGESLLAERIGQPG
ncbi:MAG TPA: 2,3-bisphosphoglycerate-independent phosphoglycerate mutase [Phycisphaerae bacterium]|nr:2,3-bisphosphoglycerate-independent phosphoglycerate mutase [Phycisphaerae bacterium]